MLKQVARSFTLCLILMAGSKAQTSPFSTSPTSNSLLDEDKQFENNVLSAILRIVDHKFDTLSGRLTAMERAVNGLQFYNIRQFRNVATKIQSTNGVLERLNTQTGHLGADSRALKLAVSILGRDVSSMQESNTRMFSELEQNILHLNTNIEEKSQELKQSIEDVDTQLSGSASDVEILLEEARTTSNSSSSSVINCTEELSSLEERIDVKFNELANQTQLVLEGLSNVSLNQDTRSHTQYKQESKSSFIDNEMLYHAIVNMTSNVVQSVSFFRHTSSMLERIIENTDNVAFEQEKLRTEIVEIFSETTEASVSDSSEKRRGNSYSEGFQVKVQEGGSDYVASQRNGRKLRPDGSGFVEGVTGGCNVSESVLRGIARFSKNGSQLLELLTELAQMSSMSMAASIDDLKNEVSKIGELLNDEQTSAFTGPLGDELSLLKIANNTKATFHLTEAVASNTGWIPYIFHNVQFVENQLNKSIELGNLMLKEMRQFRNHLPQTNVNSQDSAFNQVPRTSIHSRKKKQYMPEMSNKEILQFIYETNSRLKRIMPALTRLVAEPEPLVTLVDGRKSDEGRVEIFHDGHWGTLCDRRLGHVEASTICRHLGFAGGISAGRAYFGVGSGSFWTLNTTCLRTARCLAVTPQAKSSRCTHEEDFSIICDHMLQLVPIEESNDVNTGLIEIYHGGRWRPICSHGFSRNEAQVACKQLGYTSGWIRDGKDRSHKSSTGWMTNVSCRGNERRIDACRYNHFGRRSCPGHRPAAISCE